MKKFNLQGDSNGDDVVNEIDYSGVASYIMGDTPAAFDAEASDVDVNGTVDVRDYVGIANIITTGSIYGGTSNITAENTSKTICAYRLCVVCAMYIHSAGSRHYPV